MAGREVLLYANEQIVNSIGEGLGTVTDFISNVVNGPSWATRSGLCQKALQAYENWRYRNLDYPPYIAYLVLFVLAEDAEGAFAPHAYYPRLNKLLGLPPEGGAPPSFYYMGELWADLQKWSIEDRNEEFGRFVFRIRGVWIHVGLPLSQTLMSHNERSQLAVIFNRADLDPTDAPAIDVLRRILLQYGSHGHLLQRRTLTVLESADSQTSALKNALLEFILDELADWDGTCTEAPEQGTVIIREAKTGLRICLHEDTLAKKVNTYLRFKTNRAIPDTGLNFLYSECNKILTCFEASQYWSSPLKDQASSKSFDASSVNWIIGFQIKDIENNWNAKLKGARVRLFLPGKREGLADWIEVHHLERQGEFLVAAYSDVVDNIKTWGSNFCESFYEKGYLGLPSGWALFYGKNATQSCNGIDVLTLSDQLQIRLLGGIKTGRGNTYLRFGLPSVMLDNISGTETVKVNNSRIEQTDKTIPIWELPAGLPLSVPLRIEAYRESAEPLQTRIIKIEDPQIQVIHEEVPQRTQDGGIVNHGRSENYTVGAIVTVADRKEYTPFSKALPTHLSSRIVFLGSKPGQIRDWPKEEFPETWHPIWAIAKKGRKRWVIHFCGNSEYLDKNHCPDQPLPDHLAVKRWKEAIWVNRKISQPPDFPILYRVWKKYMEMARNAR
jgi:hypothetical protein